MENTSFINVDSRKYVELTPQVERALSEFLAQKPPAVVEDQDTGNLKRKRESDRVATRKRKQAEVKKKLEEEEEAKRIEEAKKKADGMTHQEKFKTFEIPIEGKSGNVYVDIHIAMNGMGYKFYNDGEQVGKKHYWYKMLSVCKKELGEKFPPKADKVLAMAEAPWLSFEQYDETLDEAQEDVVALAYDSLNGIPNSLL